MLRLRGGYSVKDMTNAEYQAFKHVRAVEKAAVDKGIFEMGREKEADSNDLPDILINYQVRSQTCFESRTAKSCQHRCLTPNKVPGPLSPTCVHCSRSNFDPDVSGIPHPWPKTSFERCHGLPHMTTYDWLTYCETRRIRCQSILSEWRNLMILDEMTADGLLDVYDSVVI